MNAEHQREWFLGGMLLNQHLSQEWFEVGKRYTELFDNATQTEARALKPRVRKWDRKKALKALGEKRSGELMDRFCELALLERKRIDAERDACRAALVELAPHVPLSGAKPRWYVLEKVRSTTYRTQGFGADRYARGAAELAASRARANGVEARIEPTDLGYEVQVLVGDSLDVEILHRRPNLPYAEVVRKCWAVGCNPRVFNPYLSFGFEGEIGIDYQGRVIDQKKFNEACR